MPTADEIAEERVGALRVRSAPRIEDRAHDREGAAVPTLEIVRADAPPPAGSFRSPVVTALAAVLAVGLLVFAIVVRSGPAIGAVSLVIAGLAWLFVSGRSRAVEASALRVVGRELRVMGAESPRVVGLDAIEGLGLGEEAPLRTLFARVKGEGRVLLLDGLTSEEADIAVQRLGDVLSRRA